MCIIVQKLNHISIRILCLIHEHVTFIHFEKNVNFKVKKRKKVVCGLPYTCIGNIYKRLLITMSYYEKIRFRSAQKHDAYATGFKIVDG